MNKGTARVWLVKASLGSTAAVFIILLLIPAFSSVLSFTEALRLIEIVAPVFLGYLGMASHFLFSTKPSTPPSSAVENSSADELFPLLVKGPVLVFGILVLVILGAFWHSNQPTASPGSGMTVETLAAVLSATLALLTVSTNVIVTKLFASPVQVHSEQPS